MIEKVLLVKPLYMQTNEYDEYDGDIIALSLVPGEVQMLQAHLGIADEIFRQWSSPEGVEFPLNPLLLMKVPASLKLLEPQPYELQGEYSGEAADWLKEVIVDGYAWVEFDTDEEVFEVPEYPSTRVKRDGEIAIFFYEKHTEAHFDCGFYREVLS